MEYTKDKVWGDPTFKDFIRSRGIKERTARHYESRIRYYCNFIGKSPTELIDEAEEEQQEGIKLRKRKVKSYVLDFIDHLKSKGRSSNTIKSYIETIRAFYNEYEIDIPRLKGTFQEKGENKTFEELPTKDHIKRVLDICSLRDKAIVLLHFSSGMGASEVRHLTYGDFFNAIKKEVGLEDSEMFNFIVISEKINKKEDAVGTWKINRYKTGMPYITFNSPESNKAIIQYILDRRRNNKSIKTPDEKLFTTATGLTISDAAHSLLFRRLNQRAGLGYRSKYRNFLTSHMLRKLFTSTLYKAGVDKLAIDWMLGHKINPITESYFKADVKNLKEQYLKGIADLTLEKVKVKAVTTKEYDQLLKELRQKDEDYKKLERRLEILEEFLGEKGVQIKINKDDNH